MRYIIDTSRTETLLASSALIADRVDVVTVSRRLGRANPNITLKVYAHLFRDTDAAARMAR
jgi:integrase